MFVGWILDDSWGLRKNRPPLPSPLLPRRREREKRRSTRVLSPLRFWRRGLGRGGQFASCHKRPRLACDGHLQCVCQTAFGQFDFESVLTLRFSIAHGRFRRLSKSAFLCRLADEHGLGFLGAPRFGADAAESDAGAGDVLARNVDYHCSRGQSELVRRAVAQFEINLLAAG